MSIKRKHPPAVDLGADQSQVFQFETWVADELRTVGVVVHRPQSLSKDFVGLDLQSLARIAQGRPEASARGKIAILGRDGLRVLQSDAAGNVEPAVCGNATAAAARFLSSRVSTLKIFGPNEREFSVTVSQNTACVSQTWTFATPGFSEFKWRGRHCVFIDALNPYVVIAGLPKGSEPENVRREIAGKHLNTKLAVLDRSRGGQAKVSFYNANGKHGAAPMTGLVTLALAARLSPEITDLVADGKVAFMTKSGVVTCSLPPLTRTADGRVEVSMPNVDVRLIPLMQEVD